MNLRHLFLSICLLLSTNFHVAADTRRSITQVEPVSVSCPVGTAPRLPYQLLVTYSDGTQAYRQVRWSNAALATEQEQADAARYPAGKSYTVEG